MNIIKSYTCITPEHHLKILLECHSCAYIQTDSATVLLSVEDLLLQDDVSAGNQPVLDACAR